MTGRRDGPQRRDLVKGFAAVSLVGVAGCVESLSSGRDDPSTDDGEPSTESDSEYTMEFTATDISLRTLEFEQPFSEDEILDEYYSELSYRLQRNGDEVEPDALRLEVDGEETEFASELPESRIPTVEAELTLIAEVDGEEVTAETSLTKQLPATFIYDADDETPYQFNTINDLKEYHREKRENYHQHQLERAETGDLTEQTTEKDEINFSTEGDGDPSSIGMEYSHGNKKWSTEHFESLEWPENKEEMLNDGLIAWILSYSSSAPSTNADEMSHNQAQLIKKHHGVELEDEIVPFNASNHGHGMSYHYFPETDEILASDPVGTVTRPETQPDSYGDRFSPITDYHKGEPEEEYELGTYSRKKSLGIGAYVGAAMIEQKAGVALQDSTILEGMEAIRNDSYGQDGHYERSKKLLAADHYYGSHNNQYRILSYKDQERDHIVISTDEELHEKYGEQPEEPTWQDIEQAA